MSRPPRNGPPPPPPPQGRPGGVWHHAIRGGLLARGGRLVFDAGACGRLDTQYELVSLAGVLTAELGREDVCITVRLGASARETSLPLAKGSRLEDHPVAAVSSPA